jgi:hypothetical protein
VALWASQFRGASTNTRPDSNTLLLAAVTNTTSDPTFDDAIDTALAISLRQTPYFRIAGDASVRHVLTQLGRSANEDLTS